MVRMRRFQHCYRLHMIHFVYVGIALVVIAGVSTVGKSLLLSQLDEKSPRASHTKVADDESYEIRTEDLHTARPLFWV